MFNKLFLCLLLLLTATWAAGPDDRLYPSDFADIKWGEAADRAKAKMLAKAGVAVKPTGAKEDVMEFSGGSFAGIAVDSWELQFVDNRFAKGLIYFKPRLPLETYRELNKGLTQKYRKEAREEVAEDKHRASYWLFSNSKGDFEIACDYHNDVVRLTYLVKPMLKNAKKDL